MNFIVDAQLPPQLAVWIREKGHAAKSLRELGLQSADDAAVWERAERENAIIVTKDEDFILLAAARQGPGVCCGYEPEISSTGFCWSALNDLGQRSWRICGPVRESSSCAERRSSIAFV